MRFVLEIASNKINVPIYGTYENVRHTLTDYTSLSSSDIIRVTYPTILKVVFRILLLLPIIIMELYMDPKVVVIALSSSSITI